MNTDNQSLEELKRQNDLLERKIRLLKERAQDNKKCVECGELYITSRMIPMSTPDDIYLCKECGHSTKTLLKWYKEVRKEK